MTLFQYIATDAQGAAVSGELEAGDEKRARDELEAAGLRDIQFVEAKPAEEIETLKSKDADKVLSQVADLTAAGLPLVEGLRAAAQEAGPTGLGRTLSRIADRVAGGESVEQVMNESSGGLPRYASGLVHAALRTGRLGPILDEIVTYRLTLRRLHWQVWASMIYPLLVLALSMVLVVFLIFLVIPNFESMFGDFGMELPAATRFIIQVSQSTRNLLEGIHKWWTSGLVMTLVASVIFLRLILGAAVWRRFLYTLPILGPLWAWSAAAAFSRMLAVLVEQDIPLPEALKLTADGADEANVCAACHSYADSIAEGRSLADCIRDSRQFPESLIPFVAWGERQGDLADGLRTAGEMYFERLRMRAALLRSISAPVIFVFVAIIVVVCVAGITMPLFSLMQGLA